MYLVYMSTAEYLRTPATQEPMSRASIQRDATIFYAALSYGPCLQPMTMLLPSAASIAFPNVVCVHPPYRSEQTQACIVFRIQPISPSRTTEPTSSVMRLT